MAGAPVLALEFLFTNAGQVEELRHSQVSTVVIDPQSLCGPLGSTAFAGRFP